MIRLRDHRTALPRRSVLRLGFSATLALLALELGAAIAPFMRVTRITGFGVPVVVGSRAEILERFRATRDRPMLFVGGRFFLLHAPGGVLAAYRKCTHLGCAVPFNDGEDQFHCVCHQSVFHKRTAVVVSGPAPKPLQLFHISEDPSGKLVVDTNPLNVIDRTSNKWDPAVIEIADA